MYVRLLILSAYYQEYARPAIRPANVQYQRPGLQVQVANGNSNTGMLCAYFPNLCQPLIPVAYAHPGPKIQIQQQNPSTPIVPMAREFFYQLASQLNTRKSYRTSCVGADDNERRGAC